MSLNSVLHMLHVRSSNKALRLDFNKAGDETLKLNISEKLSLLVFLVAYSIQIGLLNFLFLDMLPLLAG